MAGKYRALNVRENPVNLSKLVVEKYAVLPLNALIFL
jgi:hypothetical protein